MQITTGLAGGLFINRHPQKLCAFLLFFPRIAANAYRGASIATHRALFGARLGKPTLAKVKKLCYNTYHKIKSNAE